MNHDLMLAILNVITGLGGWGVLHLITKGTDTFTKFSLGWFFAACWSLAVIMPAVDTASQMSDLAVMSLMLSVAFLPAFPFGYIMCAVRKGFAG